MFLKYLIDSVQWMYSMILNVHVCIVANGANKGPLLFSLLNELWGKGPHQ